MENGLAIFYTVLKAEKILGTNDKAPLLNGVFHNLTSGDLKCPLNATKNDGFLANNTAPSPAAHLIP